MSDSCAKQDGPLSQRRAPFQQNGRSSNRLHCENREGYQDYNIPSRYYSGRKPGLSAMIRLKNEEEWIRPCLLSIQEWFDELAIFLQNSTDRTEAIIREMKLPQVRIYYYPFDSFPNGPGHGNWPANSIYSRAYFYNWCLAKTSCQWVSKWDGDMVAVDWLGPSIRSLLGHCEIIKIFGVNLAGPNLDRLSVDPTTGLHPQFFKVRKGTFFINGELCEKFRFPQRRCLGLLPTRQSIINQPAFLHFKWVKSLATATQAWPSNWQELPIFHERIRRRESGSRYQGEYPSVIKEMIEQRQRPESGP